MKYLTPAQRIEAYEYAKQRLLESKESGNKLFRFICLNLCWWYFENGYGSIAIVSITMFPEFNERANNRDPRKAWFPENDEGDQQRLDLLNECIAEAKAKIRTK